MPRRKCPAELADFAIDASSLNLLTAADFDLDSADDYFADLPSIAELLAAIEQTEESR